MTPSSTFSQPEKKASQENDNIRMSKVLFGNELHTTDLPQLEEKDPFITLTGKDGSGNPARIPFSEATFGRHIMLIGGIGTGKTNAINQVLARMRDRMQENSVAIVFDTKGDFYNTFYEPGDVVISNDDHAVDSLGRQNYWNIFEEIQTGPQMMENIIEISHALSM